MLVQFMSDRVYIFDTTLRDGEQSPGCSMTVPEKLRMARKLVELGVDILEAGFPIASEGDFEAVDAVSREFPWAQVAALARCCTCDVERAAKSLEHARRPRIHTFIATSDIHLKYKLKKSQRAGAGRSRGRGGTGPPLRRRRGVFRRRRRPHRSRIPGKDLESGGGRRRPHGEHSRHRGLLHAGGIWRADRPDRRRRWAIAPWSACIATTIWGWRWRTHWRRSKPARGRWNAPSTASANAPATARSKRSS